MSRAVFGKDHELGKGGAVKRRVERRRKAEIVAGYRERAPAVAELTLRERNAAELERIALGERYRRRPFVHLGGLGCECREEIDKETGELLPLRQCWSARATSETVVRVHELAFIDPSLGPCYSVTMVRPSKWQFLAWVAGSDDRNLVNKPDTWHEIAGLVCSRELGERVP